MTEGYLWTGQFEECRRVVDEGNPQSMELCDDETLKGHWSTDNNRGVDFFIINDAVFSKLCILGEDVEPCFEGASVTSPQVSSKFQKDDEFVKTLFSMVQELKELTYSLKEKGGTLMEKPENGAEFTQENAQASETPEENFQAAEENQNAAAEESQENTENFSAEKDNVNSEETPKNDTNVEEFKKEETEEEDKENKEEDNNEDKNDDEEEKKKYSLLEEKYALLEQEYNELKTNFALLQTEKEELVKFKSSVEDSKKDELIKSFYMLSDEDKKEVIEHKSEYSLDDIEAKLSIICVRKKVNFNAEDAEEKDSAPTTYSLNGLQSSEADLPAWLKRVEERKQEKEM